MIITSFNVRRVGGAPKLQAHKRMFSKLKPNIVLIQETMCCSAKACEVFIKIFPRWDVSALDGEDMFGGLFETWNPLVVDLKPFSFCARLFLKGRVWGLDGPIKLVNFYAHFF